jgi:transglutaminase-like putative cysteine protease
MILLFSLIYPANTRARLSQRNRERQYPPSKKISPKKIIVEFDLSYDLTAPGETHRVSLTVVLPKSIQDRQKILGTKFSRKPSRIFNKNGNRYAEFVITEPKKKSDITISVKAELFKYDLITAMVNHRANHSRNSQLDEFLKQERNIEKDNSQIQEIAESVEGKTETDIIRNIYNYVIDNTQYVLHRRSDWGALRALRQGKGDCSEYSDLFVALCRAKNIPARVVTGYTVQIDTDLSKHNWAEVYMQDYGWVPFDPTSGDVKNTFLKNRTFSNLSPVYIYLSHTRNDDVLHNFNFYRYTYRGDRVRLKDSIKFTQIN